MKIGQNVIYNGRGVSEPKSAKIVAKSNCFGQKFWIVRLIETGQDFDALDHDLMVEEQPKPKKLA